MGSTRRSFTEEYKQQAVGFVLDGQAVAAVADNIGVHEMTLRKWVKKERDSGGAEQKPLDPNERAELERLRSDNAQLQMQLAFAKKCRPGSRKASSEVRCHRGLGRIR